jgi:hypothetical protein
MSRKAIRSDILRLVLADLGPVFATKDVSENERVRKAHRTLVSHRNYHAFVGGGLSDNHVALGIEHVGESKARRGARWVKK